MVDSSLKIVGVDEAGRGPLAGPVVAAAVSLNSAIAGLDDSKKLSKAKRKKLFHEITQHPWSFAVVSPREIDRYNIHHASLLAFERAIKVFPGQIGHILVDGKYTPDWDYSSEAVIKGDQKFKEISAASIIAKVIRDMMMENLHQIYPMYGFDQHKGYPTAKHIKSMNEYGLTPAHRHSYAPVKNILEAVQ